MRSSIHQLEADVHRSGLSEKSYFLGVLLFFVCAFANASSGTISYSGGFTSGQLTLNGVAALNGSKLELTNSSMYSSAGSAFSTVPVNVQTFTSDFTFQITNPVSDGMAFVIQNQGSNALGGTGGGLGFQGISNSLAIKFDLYNNAGEGSDSTGLYSNGASPTVPANDLTSSGVNFHNGNVLHAQMSYNGSTLTVVLTDTVTGASATQTYSVNIPALVGASSAFVGFTAGTGGASATQDILTWSFLPGSVSATSGFTSGQLTLNGVAALNGSKLELTNSSMYSSAGSAFSTVPVNVQTFTSDFTFQITNPVSDGMAFVIQNQGSNALGGTGGGLGFQGISNSLAIKFDLYNNAGEGSDSTGLYSNGASPTVPANDLTSSGVNFHNGNVLHAQMSYNGSTLTVVLTDTVTGASATQTYSVNIPALVGASSAFVGFTAGTGGASATQDILTWSFLPGSVSATSGFTSGQLTLNGVAALNGSKLELTNSSMYSSAGSAFSTVPVNVQTFTSDFTFQITNPVSDGMAFVIQNQGSNALGGTGGGLGFQGISNSLAIKFDLYNNAGEGSDSTGLYSNGASPTVPANDLTSSGVNFHNGNVLHAQMSYNGSTLTVVLTDTVTGASATQTYSVNIPALVGASSAFVGFTAGTGGASATQDILTWSFLPGSSLFPPQFTPAAGNYLAAVTVTLNATPGSAIYYTLDGSSPTSNSILYSGPFPVSANIAVNAIAVVNGASSHVANAAYTIMGVSATQLIKHVVVIFDENVSFDHYFGTYPVATNPAGQPTFVASAGTPQPAGLSGTLLTANPNSSNSTNNAAAMNPFRLDRAQAATADQDHDYPAEQIAFHNGAMDLFPYSVGHPDSPALANQTGAPAVVSSSALTLGYFDGNTVTALWNYAQHYSLNDHFFETTFGPSTPGAINLVSGQTNGAVNDAGAAGTLLSDGTASGFTLAGDPDPTGDICSNAGLTVHMTGKNVGDLLTANNVSWGFFEGGFDLTLANANGSIGCNRNSTSLTGTATADYIPHHEPFQYYASTANPNHVRPASLSKLGTNADAANHQYDLHDFMDALAVGNMPAVSFLKPPAYQDGHAGYSDPLDEQSFLVNAVNAIQQSSFWPTTAIVIAYDDSDGWYDHMIRIVNASQSSGDELTSPGVCSVGSATPATALPGVLSTTLHAQGRCGYGPRLPMLVLSPWAKKNNLDSTATDQSSITRLVEDLFLSGQRLGGGSFDSIAGPLDNAFDFSKGIPLNPSVVVLDSSTGLVTSRN